MKQFLRKYAVRAMIGVVLVCIIGTLVYLFGIDLHRNISYQPLVSQVALTYILDDMGSPARTGRETITVEERGREGIYWIMVTTDTPGYAEGENGLTTIQNYAGRSNQYFVFPSLDIELEAENIRYMPLVKALGYGWFSYDGNLYAKFFGREEAAGWPNYRHQFRVMLRKGEYYYEFMGFCKSDSFEDFLQEAVRLVNENFGAAAAA